MRLQALSIGRQAWQEALLSPLSVLIFFPLILSVIHLPTPGGVRIHFFQIAVIGAAYLFGPFGGTIAGAAGSFAGALIMSNPYIIVGNMILGTATGFFIRRGFHPLFGVWFAFLIQLPWLIISDYFFMGLSIRFIQGLIISLFLSNTLWALVAVFALKKLTRNDD